MQRQHATVKVSRYYFLIISEERDTVFIISFSEGTADILLDCCVDYWDGLDLCPLTHSDRKKIQDFYQRSSLTAYCTAFAYRYTFHSEFYVVLYGIFQTAF